MSRTQGVNYDIDMPARTKRRATFDFHGRPFVWWVDGDKYLRIASLDKKFVTAHRIGRALGEPPTVEVIGSEFVGLVPTESRPIFFVAPEPSGPMGAWVDQLLRWAFDPDRPLVRFDGVPRFS